MSELLSGQASELNDDELLRYSRQIMLPNFDVAGQLALKNSRVLIIGLGGLGSPVSLYLAAAGVGCLILVDDDEVDISNLQRQIVHSEHNVGMSKVDSAADSLRQLNPTITIRTQAVRLEGVALLHALEQVDLVVDCTDNFATRFEINRACVAVKVPLVSGAAIRMEGQVSVFDSRNKDAPCYQCLYSDISDEQLTCSESGVMAPLVGIIGAMQAMEAIKLLSGTGQPLIGRLLLLDAMSMQWRSLKLKKDPACPCCSK
ncbi:MAG: molybdopterin/thiamine biosynthesis adenylyltransferase [Pseudohongiellaceae bacterium]|jgi:molybdopterin/thiamine biosynthesis adenylyltransferase